MSDCAARWRPQIRAFGRQEQARCGRGSLVQSPHNNSFKPNALRYTKHMEDKACHVFGSTTHVGLTQALCLTQHPCRLCGHLQLPVCGVVRAAESALLIHVTDHGLRSKLLRSEEHTSELQSLMRISYAVFCLTKNKKV